MPAAGILYIVPTPVGNLATYSHRLSKSKDLVLLGEKDVYEPLCRDCFEKARAAES